MNAPIKRTIIFFAVGLALVFGGGFLLRGGVKQSRAIREIYQAVGDINVNISRIGDIKKTVDGAAGTVQQLIDAQRRTAEAVRQLNNQLTEYNQREREIYRQLTAANAGNIESTGRIGDLAAEGAEIVTELSKSLAAGTD